MIHVDQRFSALEAGRLDLSIPGEWIKIEVNALASALLITPFWIAGASAYVRVAFSIEEPSNDKHLCICNNSQMLITNGEQIKNLWLNIPDSSIEVGYQAYSS